MHNGVLGVRHQHEISGIEPSVMQGMVINVIEMHVSNAKDPISVKLPGNLT